MKNRQQGITVTGLVSWLFILILGALLAMKLIPAYMEYGSAKNAIEAIARDRSLATPGEVRRAFDSRPAIDDINVVKAADLDITKQGNEMAIGFSYRKEVPLFANIGIYLDFAANTGQ